MLFLVPLDAFCIQGSIALAMLKYLLFKEVVGTTIEIPTYWATPVKFLHPKARPAGNTQILPALAKCLLVQLVV